MKKYLCRILLLAMLLGLTACGGENEAPKSSTPGETQAATPLLRAGYASVNITPSDSVPMNEGGVGSDGLSQGLLDYLYATCLYLVDDRGTELYLVAFDLCNLYDFLPEYRLELAEKLGVSDSQLMFSASHTHSSVNIKSKLPVISRYNEDLREHLETVAREAKKEARPVTGMYHTAIQTSGLNFVRRYIMEDGSYAGDNYGDHGLEYVAHESQGDPQLQLSKLTRQGGRDILLINFQTHPHRTAYDSDNSSLSADIVGVYRTELESRLGCHAIYFTGASGNVNPTSRIPEENIHKNYRTHGIAMADYAQRAAEDFKPLTLGPIRHSKTLFVGKSYLSENHKLPQARTVAQRFEGGMSNKEALAGYENLFVHARHAIAIVSRADWPETREVPLYAFCVGEFTACFAPFELFAELGLQIKEGSPFGATFVCCYSNDIFSYMPTELAFSHGGYGPYKCNFEPGTGEQIVAAVLAQTKSLYEAK